ncbi:MULTISPECIES: shikimate kinase [Micrococcaceae]|uniref:shikimate kinase n=1 Tax=unclassified Kocuria TaxID=2649579 RepID=UPI001EE0F084|nr:MULTISPECIES: shikimate kinase [unclassified Kocuria]
MSSGQQGPVILIGPMAAGKSFLALHLSKFFGYGFVDVDQLIVERHGVIAELFVEYGEKYFRDIEADTIEMLLRSPDHQNSVISIGGGAPMTARVQELLDAHTVVYVLVDDETVRPRIEGNTTRPMLQPDPIARWHELFEARRETYERLATIVLDGRGDREIVSMADELHRNIQQIRSA